MIKRKRAFFVLIIIFLIIGFAYVWAIWDSSKTVYHTANDTRIDIGANQYSIQEAYDSGFFSGGGSSCTGNFTFEDGNTNCRTSKQIVDNMTGLNTYNVHCLMSTTNPARSCTMFCGVGFGIYDVTTSGHCGGYNYSSATSITCNRPGAWECNCYAKCLRY